MRLNLGEWGWLNVIVFCKKSSCFFKGDHGKGAGCECRRGFRTLERGGGGGGGCVKLRRACLLGFKLCRTLQIR